MVHSILTRVELLCDDMLTEEDQETLPTGDVIYEMPVRIFVPLGKSDKTVSIADFMFKDERKIDAVERIKEVTGMVVSGKLDAIYPVLSGSDFFRMPSITYDDGIQDEEGTKTVAPPLTAQTAQRSWSSWVAGYRA